MKKASNLLRSELWRNSYIGQLNEHFLGSTAPERTRRLAVLGLEGLAILSTNVRRRGSGNTQMFESCINHLTVSVPQRKHRRFKSAPLAR
ncbi:hypothetical protein [Mesorhizobium sp.]|nr:hypothetical protein [Mesorhizobium sp.]